MTMTINFSVVTARLETAREPSQSHIEPTSINERIKSDDGYATEL